MDIMTGPALLAERYGPGARDQRLEGFAQGRWGDQARPSGWLALQVSDVSRPEVIERATADEVLGIGRKWKSLETWTFTGKLAVVRELIRRYPLNDRAEPDEAPGGLPDGWDPRLHHEVAAALGISVVAAGKLVNLAWTLDARLPGIGTALEADRLDPPRARMIADETSVLEREDLLKRAEEIILAGLPGCRTWSDLQRLVQRAVITADPEGAEKRRRQAEREHARIRFWQENTGTCGLQGTGLPTDQALAANANIEARALEYKAIPVDRPMVILRVMAMLDLLNGVPAGQRAAWEHEKDIAAKAERDEKLARDARCREETRKNRDKTRHNARPGQKDQDDDGPDNDDPDDSPDGGPDTPGPDTPGPDTPGPDNSGPDDGPDNSGPDNDSPDTPGPDNGGTGTPNAGGPDGGIHDGGFPGATGPDDGPADGPLPEDPFAGCQPGDWPGEGADLAEPPCGECGASDCHCGAPSAGGQRAGDQPAEDHQHAGSEPGPHGSADDPHGDPRCDPGRDRPGSNSPGSSRPGSNSPAGSCPAGGGARGEAPGCGAPGSDDGAAACPACGGTAGGTGLRVRASLTLPAGALEWLAGQSSGLSVPQGRVPKGSGAGGGGSGATAPGGIGPGGAGPGSAGRGSRHGGDPRGAGHGSSALGGTCPSCGKWGISGTDPPVRENLTFPLLTLLGLAERPGEAHGLGALDAGLVRELAKAGARHLKSDFCVTIVDDQGHAIGHGCCKPIRGAKAPAAVPGPEPAGPDRATFIPAGKAGPDGGYGSWILALPGARYPLAAGIGPVPTYDCDHRLESPGHDPGDKLRHLVQVRDGTCSFPACSRHARESDFEHCQPFEKGGRTCACNCHSCSRSCHRVKQSAGWSASKPRPGWTRWITMAGRTYQVGPWKYPV